MDYKMKTQRFQNDLYSIHNNFPSFILSALIKYTHSTQEHSEAEISTIFSMIASSYANPINNQVVSG